MKFRDPIINLSEAEIVRQPHLTEAITKAWICRMIDAGWRICFQGDIMFIHADEPVELTREVAYQLLLRYWHRLDIPTPYNWRSMMSRPLIRAGQEARPDEVIIIP